MIDKGFIKEAIHCYVTAIRLMPKFSAAHSNLGSVFKEQGKLQQAIAHYQEAIKIDPSFADAFSNLGTSLRWCCGVHVALFVALRVCSACSCGQIDCGLHHEPQITYRGSYYAGNAFKDAGKVEDAIACYSTAINLEPNYAEAYANLAAVHKDCGRVVESIQLYRKALELRPDFGEAIANLTHCLVSAAVLLRSWVGDFFCLSPQHSSSTSRKLRILRSNCNVVGVHLRLEHARGRLRQAERAAHDPAVLHAHRALHPALPLARLPPVAGGDAEDCAALCPARADERRSL
jgi:tetratricopeptide (TPR) repeat protein